MTPQRSNSRSAGGASRRLNRSKDKDSFIQQLVEQGPFKEYRDVLIFAAAIGWHESKRIPIAAKGEPIRWEVATNRRGTEALTNMIAAAYSNSPEILGDEQFDERLMIFEQYANGGLDFLEALLVNEPRPIVDVILELVQKACRSSDVHEAVNLADAVNELEF